MAPDASARSAALDCKLNRCSLHFIVNIDLGLRSCDRLVPRQCREDAYADALARKRSDKATSARMARSSTDTYHDYAVSEWATRNPIPSACP